jgi:succinate dehydrogenase/fumarate reductase flavoprotein subunit|tara:strand:- start:77 stop:433 length:357 start_codon:yes stop_codon:yes gene_type:complete
MKISDQTSISMPMRNLLSILAAVAIGVWAYFGVIERLNNIETRQTLFEADLVKAADQTPVDQEQFMLLEFVSEQVDGISEDLEDMSHNKVNIQRLQTDMEKALEDIEDLKDKVRANGN